MEIKEKILLVELLLRDVRGNWGWEKDKGICSRAIMARDLCVEIANELNDNNYSILASCCDTYIADYFEDGDGRYFRDGFPHGYEGMDSLHGLKYTYMDKSKEFKFIAKEYLTYPEYRFEDWEESFKIYMTNEQKIREEISTIEKLAEFLIDYEDMCGWYFTSDGDHFYTEEEAIEHEIEWLQKEYEE